MNFMNPHKYYRTVFLSQCHQLDHTKTQHQNKKRNREDFYVFDDLHILHQLIQNHRI